jgi:hypothetical protein
LRPGVPPRRCRTRHWPRKKWMALPARGPRIRRHASRIAGRSSDSPRRTGLPAVYAVCEDVDEGGLLSYGANVADISRRAARYAGRILEGAKPADLPVEQATAVELVITMRTAKALGLTIPRRCCGKRSG